VDEECFEDIEAYGVERWLGDWRKGIGKINALSRRQERGYRRLTVPSIDLRTLHNCRYFLSVKGDNALNVFIQQAVFLLQKEIS
jgi:hypothetical protein